MYMYMYIIIIIIHATVKIESNVTTVPIITLIAYMIL